MSGDLERVFGEADREQLSGHGIALGDATRQLELLREPTARHRRLERAATIGDGKCTSHRHEWLWLGD